MSEPLSKVQEIILDRYENGQFKGQVHTTEDSKHVGDTLFSFLMCELSLKEDCESLEEAVYRIDTAVRQLSMIKNAIYVHIPESGC